MIEWEKLKRHNLIEDESYKSISVLYPLKLKGELFGKMIAITDKGLELVLITEEEPIPSSLYQYLKSIHKLPIDPSLIINRFNTPRKEYWGLEDRAHILMLAIRILTGEKCHSAASFKYNDSLNPPVYTSPFINNDYKKLDAENECVRRQIKGLEEERQKVFNAHRDGLYTPEEFLEQKDRINRLIAQKMSLLEEKHVEEFDMDQALDFCFRFVRNTAKTWTELSSAPEQQIRFQNHLFPEKLTFDGERFGTAKLTPIYELNQQSGADSSKLVTPRGIEPRFTP